MSSKMIRYLVDTAIPNLRDKEKTYDEIRQYHIDHDARSRPKRPQLVQRK